ncbi:MAG: roadblock/LC7 domain-containing protein [Deltaproteobacteria bacterium]|nr:roadblock/LC7 domain-containing protein [Deltaproteobacteria bacterium]
MAGPDTVIFEEEFTKINAVCDRLRGEANALVVFIVDKNGQLISASGETEHLDTTSLASLTAGNVAATGGIAKLLKEKEFATQFHEGEKANIHIQIVGQRVILVVIFDTRSSLGLVRLRVRKAAEELNKVFDSLVEKAKKPGAMSVLEEITDEDIENLFNE